MIHKKINVPTFTFLKLMEKRIISLKHSELSWKGGEGLIREKDTILATLGKKQYTITYFIIFWHVSASLIDFLI